MAIVQTEALVVRSYRLGETSLIVSLFTRDHGLLRCVAKGARGPKSRFGASLEPGVRVSAVPYRKLTRDLQLLSKTDIAEVLPALWEHLAHVGAPGLGRGALPRCGGGKSGGPISHGAPRALPGGASEPGGRTHGAAPHMCVVARVRARGSFEELLLPMARFWSDQGCVL